MNIQRMENEAGKLIHQWEQNRISPDLEDRGEFVRGVVYGLKLMYTLVHKNVHDHVEWRSRRCIEGGAYEK